MTLRWFALIDHIEELEPRFDINYIEQTTVIQNVDTESEESSYIVEARNVHDVIIKEKSVYTVFILEKACYHFKLCVN